MDEETLRKAKTELIAKPLKVIQRETALLWCSRAMAASLLAAEAATHGRHGEARAWHSDAVEYSHEAIEHAALANDETLRLVRQRLHSVGVAP